MRRLWPEGESISVQSDTLANPLAFTWQGRVHPVDAIVKRWRIDEGWWRKQVWREYFKLATTTGLLVVIYKDWRSGRWYLQGLYD
jgi:hypothetical protein